MTLGTYQEIISGGNIWWGKSNAQIACLFQSRGFLLEYPSITLPAPNKKGRRKYMNIWSMWTGQPRSKSM